MLGKVLALSTLCAFVILSALMQSTSPATIHPIGILFVFILLYVVALGVFTFFISIFQKIWASYKAPKTILAEGERGEAHTRRAYLYGSVLALGPIMYVGMNSIGRTGFYEFLLIIVFEFVACFYIAKQRF